MKKIINIAFALLCMVGLLASCDSDRASNPTFVSPGTFVLNTPSYSTQNVDLATSSQLNFSWQYPDYGFPVSVNYVLQYSINGNFDGTQYNDAILAEDQTVDYVNGDSIYNATYGAVTSEELAKKLEQIALYPEDYNFAAQQIHVRAMAYVGSDTIYSNPVKVNVTSYFVNLTPAMPQIWNMLGTWIANGSWANPGVIGVDWQPLYTVPGATYDLNTGEGPLTYTGYFSATATGEGFKILTPTASWDYGMCGDDATSLFMGYRDGNGGTPQGNIFVGESGYYTITLDTKAKTGKMVAAAKDDYKVFEHMSIAGGFNGWSTDATTMTPVNIKDGVINHDWTCTVTFTDTDAIVTESSGFKFTDGNTWWGGDEFPYGTSANQNNIQVEPGTYTVVFNDITGSYLFILQE